MGCPVSKKKIETFPAPKIKEFEPYNDGKKLEFLNTMRIIDDVAVTSRYKVQCHLGSGAFSEVFLVESKESKHPYAIKVLDFRTNKVNNFDDLILSADVMNVRVRHFITPLFIPNFCERREFWQWNQIAII